MKYKALLAPEHYDAPKRPKPLAEGNAVETVDSQLRPPDPGPATWLPALPARAYVCSQSAGQGPQLPTGSVQPPSLPSTPEGIGAPAPRWQRVPPLPPARPPARPCSASSTACGRRSLGCTGTEKEWADRGLNSASTKHTIISILLRRRSCMHDSTCLHLIDRSYLMIASLMRSGGVLDAPNKPVGKGRRSGRVLMTAHCMAACFNPAWLRYPDAPCAPSVILGLLGVDREVVRRHAILPRDDAAEKI